MNTKSIAMVAAVAALMSGVTQATNSGWYLRPLIGYSDLSDQTATASATGAQNFDGEWDVSTSGGFNAGLGLGYRYNPHFSAELFWEYRTNDTDTRVIATDEVYPGNYASNLFYLNGYYHFISDGKWQSYAGLGVGWTQEIDIDLEQGNLERSYSADGDFSFQFILGGDYPISRSWQINTELRYALMSSIELQGEENAAGTVKGLDYNPLSINLGLKYQF